LSPLFGKSEEEKREEEARKQKIKEILSRETIRKQGEYKHGKIYLTKNYLLWEKKEKYDSKIIPLDSIRKTEKAMKIGMGNCLKVTFGEEETEEFFPFISEGLMGTVQLDDIQGWALTLKKGVSTRLFENIVYAGGHSAYPEKHNGRLLVTPTALTFQETRGDFNLEISLESVENISVQTASEISRLSTVLVGPLWSMGFPMKSKFVLVEYEDEVGMKQTPLFDFPFDSGDKKKGKVMRTLHRHLKKIKKKPKEKPELEDPIKILKTRYAKGEISKEEYEEMKKELQS